MKICVVGPVCPNYFSNSFFTEQRDQLSQMQSNRGIQVYLLVAALIELGHEVIVITLSDKIETNRVDFYRESLHLIVLRERTSHKKKALSLFGFERTEIVNTLRNIDCDVVHAHWTYEYAWAVLSIKPDSLVTPRDSPFSILRFDYSLYRILYTLQSIPVRILAKNLTFTSSYLLKKWKTQFFWLQKSSIIPNILPFETTDVALVEEPYKFICITESGKRKNLIQLLNAWSGIKRAIPNAELSVYGHGIDSIFLKEGLFLPDVKFKGLVGRDELKAALKSSHMLIQPSLEESFGNTILEAMCYGIPIVAGIKSGAIPEILRGYGVLVDVRESKKIEEGVIWMIEHRDERFHMQLKAQENAKLKYSPRIVAEKYLSEYQKLV